jgi:hypothetical protein
MIYMKYAMMVYLKYARNIVIRLNEKGEFVFILIHI